MVCQLIYEGPESYALYNAFYQKVDSLLQPGSPFPKET